MIARTDRQSWTVGITEYEPKSHFSRIMRPPEDFHPKSLTYGWNILETSFLNLDITQTWALLTQIFCKTQSSHPLNTQTSPKTLPQPKHGINTSRAHSSHIESEIKCTEISQMNWTVSEMDHCGIQPAPPQNHKRSTEDEASWREALNQPDMESTSTQHDCIQQHLTWCSSYVKLNPRHQLNQMHLPNMHPFTDNHFGLPFFAVELLFI